MHVVEYADLCTVYINIIRYFIHDTWWWTTKLCCFWSYYLEHSAIDLRVSTTTLRQFQSGLKTIILFRLAYGTRLGAFVTV